MTSDDRTATSAFLHADFAPGTVLAGRFRIDSLLGVGGMGVVYRATDIDLDVPVALKLLRPELASRPEAFERFRQELLLARQVSSAHVVRIHDIARHEGRWLISMDVVDGESLDRRMDREGPLDVDDALRLTRQIAEGLGAAHDRGVVHRDLKPANVLLDRAGNAYVNDFGVARSLVSSGLSQSGATVGTPDYLSPEQARGDPVDGRSDLYALGLILYEMLSGALPFSGGTMAEMLGQRMHRTPPPLTRARPGVPAWVARLVERMLRPQPAHRLQTAAAVIAAIDAQSVPRDVRPRRATLVAAVAVLGVALAVGAWWAWWPRAEAVPPVATAAPLQRVLVLPIGVDGDADAADAATRADQLRAATDYLRAAIAAGGLVVVDGARTQQALRQLGSEAATPDVDAVRRLAAADRVLSVRVARVGDGWQARATLGGVAGAGRAASADTVAAAQPRSIDGAVAATPVAALQSWWPAATSALGVPPTAAFAMPPPTALAQFGAAARLQADGDLAGALRGFTAATDAAPTDARAWLARAQVAQAIGEEDAALAAIAQAQRAGGDASPLLRQRLVAERALLEGDAPAAAAAWRAIAAGRADDTFVHLNVARALGAGGDFNGAMTALRALVLRDGDDPRTWFELGKFSILQGEARRAVDDYLVRALVLYKRSGDRFGEAETVNALGVGYGRLGQTADAEEQYRKAAELRRTVGNRRGVASSLRNLAGIVSLRGEFALAATDLEQARALYAALGDRRGLAATETELGLLHEERGDYRSALDAYRRALQASQAAGDAHGAAETFNHIGFAHFQLGAYDSAQAFWQQAVDAYAKLGDRTGDVRTRQNLGLLDIARGRWSSARERLQASLVEAGRQQMAEEAAVSRRNLAELALSQGQLDEALAQASQAMASFAQRDDRRGQSDAALLRVDALLAAHADAGAQDELTALDAALKEESGEQRAIAAIHRAELARRRGDASAARRALDDAGRLADASGVRVLQLQVALQRAPPGRLPATLDTDTAALGHAGLRLAWAERAMADALAAGRPADALRTYRDVQALLRGGEVLRGWQLHALAARAATGAGDDAAAIDAARAAETALAARRARLPADLRDGFAASAEVVAWTSARNAAGGAR